MSVNKNPPGRPIGFEKTKVLAASIPIFSKHGFYEVSVTNLTDEFQIDRSSFYHTFISKENFYCEVLKLYFENNAKNMARILNAHSSCQDALYALIDYFYDICTAEEFNYGCLLVNAGVEINTSNMQLNRTIMELRSAMIRLFQNRIEQGILDRQISDKLDANSLATFLKLCLDGMTLHGRGKRDIPKMIGFSSNLRDIIESWST